MNLNESFNNLIKGDDGIFYSKKESKISYPEVGNAICFEIEDNSFWFNHRNNIIIEKVKQICPDATFFDIGGGNGYVAKGLQNNNFDTVLIEPGKHGAVNAKNRGLNKIICSTLEDIELKNESIESVGLFDVVEHINEDKQFLEEIFHAQKSGSYIFITVPAYNFLWSYEDIEAGHFRRFTLNKIELLLNQIGYSTTFKSYIFSFLPLPIFLFRTIPNLLKIKNINKQNDVHKKDHTLKENFITKLFNKILSWELNMIRKNKIIHFGSTCFIIAQKK